MRWLAILWLIWAVPVGAQDGFVTLKGHGGPIKGIAVSPDGQAVLTASFDYSVGVWDLAALDRPDWLEGHRAAVNAVHYLKDGRVASGGDDFSVRVWGAGGDVHLGDHAGKVMALASHGSLLASASWDGTVGLWDVKAGTLKRSFSGHRGGVNDVAFSQDGRVLFSASADGSIRRWDVASGDLLQIEVKHGFGVNQMILRTDLGWLAYGAVDGGTRAIDLETGAVIADLTLERRPVLAMAATPDGAEIAVGDGQGYIMVVDTKRWRITRDFRAAQRGPIWALAYSADGARIFAGGIADEAFGWPLGLEAAGVEVGARAFLEDPETMPNGARQFYRKCSVCHSLSSDGGRKAGPSLHGIFGRRAGTLAGYRYSAAMLQSDIVWSAETIDKLFDLGPDHYTPGSKMPMQRIARAQDRVDLIEFLRQSGGVMGGAE